MVHNEQCICLCCTHFSGMPSCSPSWMAAVQSSGSSPLIVHPMERADPRISRTVPSKVLALERGRMMRATLYTSSQLMSPSCEMCFTFLRSRGGSLSALMSSAVAEGTTSTVTLRFCTRSLQVTFMPFHSLVALQRSSPTDLGDSLWGPTLGARAGTGGTSPPGTRTTMILTSLGSNLAMVDLSYGRALDTPM